MQHINISRWSRRGHVQSISSTQQFHDRQRTYKNHTKLNAAGQLIENLSK